MKILYISPEHISGTLPLFCQGHRKKGNYARYLTLFPTPFDFPEDLSLKLYLHPDKNWIIQSRKLLQKIRGIDFQLEKEGNPPFWSPAGWIEKCFFDFRDWLNAAKIYRFVEQNKLYEYDLFHLEQGMGIFRDARLIKQWKQAGKKFACFYHGNDVRNRGVFSAVHQISDLNLTSELDLMAKYPGIKYLFLPIDTDAVRPQARNNERLKIVHAARSRYNKGSDFIIQTVKDLEKDYPVELVLIENMPHDKCMELKAECDICIDQIADKGGWGYGMSSVESLAQGLAVCTYLNPQYQAFIPDHPFVNVDYNNLRSELIRLIQSADYRQEMSVRGRDWLVKTHSINAVMDQLYIYYQEAGII